MFPTERRRNYAHGENISLFVFAVREAPRTIKEILKPDGCNERRVKQCSALTCVFLFLFCFCTQPSSDL